MARTNKVGIDYFPFDVDFFNDEKIEFTSARFGIKGEIIAIRLLCKIYRSGYYTNWNEDECTLLAKRAGDGITPTLVSDIVKELAKRGFFEKSLFDRFNILTSKGIQKRYFEITSRYKQVDVFKEYLLINLEFRDNANIITINVNNNPNNTHTCTQIEIESKLKLKTNNAALINADINGDFKDVISEWLEYKKSRRESYKNQKSINAFISKLKNLSGNSPEVARKIIDESMSNNWAGIFELKPQKATSFSGLNKRVNLFDENN